MELNNNIPNKYCPNIEKPKISNNIDDDNDSIYSEYIKGLNFDKKKLELNLKKSSKNN